MEEQKDKKDKKVRKDKRLSSKINSRFIALTLIAILCTMILSTTVYYDLFKKEIMRDLENYTQTLKSAGLFDDISELRNVRIKNTELRITLVAPDGTVKYDNMADPESMGKHNDRPEIEEAFEKGEGEDTRLSQTLNMSTFYYAIRLSNGCVLRVSKETSSIVSVFLKGLPSMTVIMLVLVTAVVLISRYLTKSIVRPIGQMAKDLDHIDDINAYKEIRPLIDTINCDRQIYMRQADYFALTGYGENDISGMKYKINPESLSTSAVNEMLSYVDDSLYAEAMLMYVSIKGFVRYALAAVLLIFTISSVNIVNTTIGNLHMRRKELAQLRVIGMSRKRLIKTVMLEGVMTTIVSNVIGFVIGIAFSFGLFYYLDMVISVSRSIAWWAFGVGVAASGLIICGSIYLALRDLPNAVVEDLKVEE